MPGDSIEAHAKVMLRLQKLTFRDATLEISFRRQWDASSNTLIILLSAIMIGIWSVATWNVHSHCIWSRFVCRFLDVLGTSVILIHSYIQYQLRMHPGWRVQEVQKAYALVADLAASMMYIMLVRDAEGTVGVPTGGTHDWMYAIHGWAILFLQVTTRSAVHLHLINLLVYCIVEGFLLHQFGWTFFPHGGLRHMVAVLSLCGALPFGINVLCEVQSRRDFLCRARPRAPHAQQEWLCP